MVLAGGAAASEVPPRAVRLAALEGAARVVVGRVERVDRLDRHGYLARIEVERELGTGPGGESASRPDEVALVAFEELATGRPPRLRAGTRVLVGLGGRPRGSLWRERLAARPREPGVHELAGEGRALLEDPDDATAGLLAAWLAAQRRDPGGPAALELLAELVRRADPRLALEAAAALEAAPGLAARLPEPGWTRLREALLDPERPEVLRRALLELAGERRLSALRPVVAELAKPERGSGLELPALAALAALDGGLCADRLAALLADDRPEARRLAVRAPGPPLGPATLARLARSDPDPGVRREALAELLRRRGVDALADGLRGLGDPDPGVRAAAAHGVAALGEPAVEPLVAEVHRTTGEAREAALAALAACGAAGHRALGRLAASHPDPAVRGLARLALGKLDAGH